MVADNWVKRNPTLSYFLTFALTLMCSFVIVKAEWIRTDNKDFEKRLSQKVEQTEFDKKIDHLEEFKAEKIQLDDLNKKIDVIYNYILNSKK